MPWDHCSVIDDLFVSGLSVNSIVSTAISPRCISETFSVKVRKAI